MTLTECVNAKLVPARIAQWAAQIDFAAQAAGLDPVLVGAICDRETNGGTSRDCDRQGASCTGDFGKRNPMRWGYALPPDGRGWGRGLMQIDFGGHKEWCLKTAPDGRYLWEIPEENFKQACGILHAGLTALRTEPPMICAYNAGPGNAFRVLGTLAGQSPTATQIVAALDRVTSGGDYVSWVLNRRNAFRGICAPL